MSDRRTQNEEITFSFVTDIYSKDEEQELEKETPI